MANEIDEIRARWAKATPGPFRVLGVNDAGPDECMTLCRSGSCYVIRDWDPALRRNDLGRSDAEAIAHAHADIATLLAALDAKDAELRAVERERDEARARYAMVLESRARTEDECDGLHARIADLRAQLARAKAEGAREALERVDIELCTTTTAHTRERKATIGIVRSVAARLAGEEPKAADRFRATLSRTREYDAGPLAAMAAKGRRRGDEVMTDRWDEEAHGLTLRTWGVAWPDDVEDIATALREAHAAGLREGREAERADVIAYAQRSVRACYATPRDECVKCEVLRALVSDLEQADHVPTPQGDHTVSSADFRADPARYVRESAEHPVRVVGEDGATRMTLGTPAVDDDRLARIAALYQSWVDGDEPEGAPSPRRTLLAIGEVLADAPQGDEPSRSQARRLAVQRGETEGAGSKACPKCGDRSAITYRAYTVPPKIEVGMMLSDGSNHHTVLKRSDARGVVTVLSDWRGRQFDLAAERLATWTLVRDWTVHEQVPCPDCANETQLDEPAEWGWYIEGDRCISGFSSRAEAIRCAVVEYEAEGFLVGPMRDVDVAQLRVESIVEDFELSEPGINAADLACCVEEQLEIEDNRVCAGPGAQDALDEWATEYLRVTALPGAQEALDAWAREHLVSNCERYCAGHLEPEPTPKEIAAAKASADAEPKPCATCGGYGAIGEILAEGADAIANRVLDALEDEPVTDEEGAEAVCELGVDVAAMAEGVRKCIAEVEENATARARAEGPMRHELTRERLVECLERMQEAAAADEPCEVPAPPFIEAMSAREVCEWDVELYKLAIRAFDQDADAKPCATCGGSKGNGVVQRRCASGVERFVPCPDCAGESGGSE